MKNRRKLTQQELVKALKLFNIGGIIGAIPFNLWGGVFITGFALYLGANNIDIGLLGSIPILAGIIQPLASYWAEKSRMRRKLFTNICYALCLLFWIPPILIPFFYENSGYSLFLFFSSFTLANIFIAMTNPPYISWLGDIVPEEIRGRYFAKRNMWAGLVGMCFSLGVGRLVDRLPHKIGFPLAFSLGALFAVVEIIIIFLQPEPYREPIEELDLLRDLINPLRNKDFKLYTFFVALWNFSVIMPGQFFSVFMLKYLNLSYTTIVLVGVSSGIASLLAQPFFGYLADRYANKTILFLTSFLASFIPFLYLFMNPRFPLFSLMLLYAVNIIAGAIWAGITLTQFNLLLALSPSQERMSYVATHSAFISLLGASSPFIGGVIANALKDFHFSALGLDITNIKVLFTISTILRLLSLPLLGLVKEGKEEESPLELVREVVPRKPLEMLRALRWLRGGTESARIRAIKMLSVTLSPLAIDNLLRLLGDPSPDVRREAILALGKMKDTSIIEPLLNHLTVEKGQTEAIVETLKELGAEKEIEGVGYPPSLNFFADLDKKGEGELLQILRETRDEEVASYIAFLLAKRGCKSALPQIVESRGKIISPLYKRQWVYSIGKLLDVNVYPLLSLDRLELYQRMEALLRRVGVREEGKRMGIMLALRYFGEGDYVKFIKRLAKSLSYEKLSEEIKEMVNQFLKGNKLSVEEAVLLALCLLREVKK